MTVIIKLWTKFYRDVEKDVIGLAWEGKYTTFELSLVDPEWFHQAAEVWEKGYIAQEKNGINKNTRWETVGYVSTADFLDSWKGALGVRERVIGE